MKLSLAGIAAIVAAGTLTLGAPAAMAGNVHWSINIGTPGVVYAPPPVVYASPPPVVYAPPRVVHVHPRPVYVQPVPVVPYGRVHYERPRHRGHHVHHHGRGHGKHRH